ncbi:protein KASH5 [Melopsittacus undulatus]|uniref:protein KASH5 n=1 Tax=Melopsittacus undulatus TaxID=13146 RepID=UPI00146AE79B|nr:protein KASH5 [Melopsittacus undulatus]
MAEPPGEPRPRSRAQVREQGESTGGGRVPAARVLQYLSAVTGRPPDERRLRALGSMLEAADGACAGAGLDRAAFHSVMGRWIRKCRRGSWLGEELEVAAGDLGPAEEAPTEAETEHGAEPGPEPLQFLSRAQLLAIYNQRLQREAEASEEQNSRLGEELQELRGQLRSTQQALERARAATEELEDTKAAVKGLEEQNLELRRRMRTLEKEQSSLRSHADGLQEETQHLHSEGQELRAQLQALVPSVTLLEPLPQAQLCRCSELLLSHEATAAQAGQRVTELTTALEEYETAVREQRLEAARLQHQLDQLQETCGLQLWGTLGDTPMGQVRVRGPQWGASMGGYQWGCPMELSLVPPQEGAEPQQDEAELSLTPITPSFTP